MSKNEISTAKSKSSKSIEYINGLTDNEIRVKLSALFAKVNEGKFLTHEEDFFVGGIIKKQRESKLPSSSLNRQAERAKTILTIANTRAVHKIANNMMKHMPMGVTKEDCLSEGMIGMARAITTYDPDTGYKFLTYATLWIRHYIQRHSMEIARVTKLPGTNVGKMVRIDKKIKDITENGGKVTSKVMSQLLEKERISPAEYNKIKAFNRFSLSFDAPAFSEDSSATISDLIDSSKVETDTMGNIAGPEEYMANQNLSDSLRKALDQLTVSEKDVLLLVYGTGIMTEFGERKMSATAARDQLGMKRREFERVLESAKRNLRKALEDEDALPEWVANDAK